MAVRECRDYVVGTPGILPVLIATVVFLLAGTMGVVLPATRARLAVRSHEPFAPRDSAVLVRVDCA